MVSSEVLTRGRYRPMQIGATLYVVGGEHRHRDPDERSLGYVSLHPSWEGGGGMRGTSPCIRLSSGQIGWGG